MQRPRLASLVRLCALALILAGCASALDIARLTVNAADAAIGQAALLAEGRRQAAEDRCLELEQPGQDACLAQVRRTYRPLFDAFGVWRLARALWDAVLAGGTAEELEALRVRYCELRQQLSDRLPVPDWPTAPCGG